MTLTSGTLVLWKGPIVHSLLTCVQVPGNAPSVVDDFFRGFESTLHGPEPNVSTSSELTIYSAITPGKTASIGGGLNAGLFTMTHGLALELSEKQIRVNCL